MPNSTPFFMCFCDFQRIWNLPYPNLSWVNSQFNNQNFTKTYSRKEKKCDLCKPLHSVFGLFFLYFKLFDRALENKLIFITT